MHGIINKAQNMVTWYYIRSGETAMNGMLKFNFRTNEWFVGTAPDIHSAIPKIFVDEGADLISDMVGTIAAQTLTIRGLSNITNRQQMQLYGSVDKKILKDQDIEVFGSTINQDVPFVETGDITYDSLDKVKEIYGMYLDAAYDGATCSGIKVEVSGRQLLADTVTYTNVGTWTPSLAEDFLTFAGINAIIFRFKFTFVEITPGAGVQGAQFNSWAAQQNLPRGDR
jgi:hypothetical protein